MSSDNRGLDRCETIPPSGPPQAVRKIPVKRTPLSVSEHRDLEECCAITSRKPRPAKIPVKQRLAAQAGE